MTGLVSLLFCGLLFLFAMFGALIIAVKVGKAIIKMLIEMAPIVFILVVLCIIIASTGS